MRNSQPPASIEAAEPLFVGDHIALDFINTSYGVDEGARECFRGDADVAEWLRSQSLPADSAGCRPGELLRAALELRRVALDLLEKRTAGIAGNPRDLNRLLGAGSAYDELLWPRGGPPVLTVRERLQGADGLLLPVGRAVAGLLTGPDFGLVRRCEAGDCTLWFLDRTKSHSRRWCSPAVCGNRAKVAAFRARNKST